MTMLESDDNDGVAMTASRRELRERARDPEKRKAYVKKIIDERMRRSVMSSEGMRGRRSDSDSDSSAMTAKRVLSARLNRAK